jgi:hypothetical protein
VQANGCKSVITHTENLQMTIQGIILAVQQLILIYGTKGSNIDIPEDEHLDLGNNKKYHFDFN